VHRLERNDAACADHGRAGDRNATAGEIPRLGGAGAVKFEIPLMLRRVFFEISN
jgi:hypothetical protein